MRKKNKLFFLFIGLLFGVQNVKAQISLGTEFKANTTVINHQRNPVVGMDSTGNSIIVWESLGTDGSDYGIFAQRFDQVGIALGTEFQVNVTNANSQRFPDVAVNKSANKVVVWQSMNQDGSGNGIYMRRYNAVGVALGSETLVNTTTVGNQLRPKVSMADNGNFVVTWMSENQDGSSFGIYAQRYNAAGVALGAELLVNDITANYQGYPNVAMQGSGEYIIAWQSSGTDGSGSGIYARRFDASGTAIGLQFLVNVTTAENQQEPSVAVEPNGEFGIIWSSYNQDGSEYGIYAQLYDAAGAVSQAEFLINDSTYGNQLHPEINASPNGRYYITWTNDALDASQGGVYFTALGVDGGKSFAPLLINNRMPDYQQFATVASANDSLLVIAYQDGLEDGSGTHDGDRYGIYSRIVSLNNVPLPVGLLSFSVKKLDATDLVEWSTSSEQNNSHFNVQRSANALDFETLGRVNSSAPQGTSNQKMNYSFIDKDPLVGNNYYRLEQVDIDGHINYSEIINIIWLKNGVVSLYPNPTSGILNIELELSQFKKSIIQGKLLDASGKLVLSEIFMAQTGDNTFHLDLSTISIGIYHLQLFENGMSIYSGAVSKR